MSAAPSGMPPIKLPDGYTGPLNLNPADGESRIIIYGYVPSLAANIAAVVCFLILLLAHVVWLFRYRGTRIFQFLLSLSCLMEVIGYAFRAMSHKNPFVVMRFVLNYFFIVCAPIFISAAIYLGLARLLPVVPSNASPLSAKALVTSFIAIDTVTIVTQVVGAALVGSGYSAQAKNNIPPMDPEDANWILVAGLSVQTLASVIFIAIMVRVMISTRGTVAAAGVWNVLWVLLISDLLIVLRTIFRLAEGADGAFGSISGNQSLFIALEMVPVIIAVALWVLVPLGKWSVYWDTHASDKEARSSNSV
ncbi:RTA1 like protein-domain-containing protein [Auriculariales sp. MPI-PUGE-AT-0066]|nr:RTA1 like protein-domain-containing protein [Auriculariales sp. MPI-PUGE-AT-0066]